MIHRMTNQMSPLTPKKPVDVCLELDPLDITLDPWNPLLPLPWAPQGTLGILSVPWSPWSLLPGPWHLVPYRGHSDCLGSWCQGPLGPWHQDPKTNYSYTSLIY